MPPVRIALAETPPMLTGILKETVEAQPDLEYVGSVSLQEAIDTVLPQHRADVLVVGVADPERVDFAKSLLIVSPGTRVLMIARSGERAVLYELYPMKTELGDVSPQGLVDAIRRRGNSVH